MTSEFESLNLVELIDLLEPVPAPPSVPLTPQTPGWIILGVVLAVAIYYGLRWGLRKYWQNAYRRAALKELEASEADPAVIANILRRTALAAYPRQTVASLNGSHWLEFLDRTYPGSGFASGAGRVLQYAPYRDCGSDAALENLARDWIKRHRQIPESAR